MTLDALSLACKACGILRVLLWDAWLIATRSLDILLMTKPKPAPAACAKPALPAQTLTYRSRVQSGDACTSSLLEFAEGVNFFQNNTSHMMHHRRPNCPTVLMACNAAMPIPYPYHSFLSPTKEQADHAASQPRDCLSQLLGVQHLSGSRGYIRCYRRPRRCHLMTIDLCMLALIIVAT